LSAKLSVFLPPGVGSGFQEKTGRIRPGAWGESLGCWRGFFLFHQSRRVVRVWLWSLVVDMGEKRCFFEPHRAKEEEEKAGGGKNERDKQHWGKRFEGPARWRVGLSPLHAGFVVFVFFLFFCSR